MASQTEANPRAASLVSTSGKSNQRYRTEGNVVLDIAMLLDALGVGPIEREYSNDGGKMDIYLPTYRTVIEAKARPYGSDPTRPQNRPDAESPKDQLDRYVAAEIRYELGGLRYEDEDTSERDWTGIITDGSHWHVYQYPHVTEPRSQEFYSDCPGEADELIRLLSEVFGGETVGKGWIPADPSDLFREKADELLNLFKTLPPAVRPTTRTKRALWLDMLRVSGMQPARGRADRLFVTHSFLIAVARMVSHLLTSKQKDHLSVLRDSFASWITDFHQGQGWAGSVWEIVDRHDWRRRRNDVMRALYMEFVPQADRKVFGEYYTPDWLASIMVEEALDDVWLEQAVEKAETAVRNNRTLSGTGVLDPACGSGTFLYHAALRILNCPAMSGLAPTRQADIVVNLLHGIDIHPVAVEIAKTNLCRVLPARPTQGDAGIQIRMGDSLMISEADHESLFASGDSMRLTTPKGREIFVPMEFVRMDSFADDMRRIVRAASKGQAVPAAILNALVPATRDGVDQCRIALEEAIKEEGNSVWTWYAVNLASPQLLAERKVDRIVANPPWVRLSDIQEQKRKRAMEEFGARLHLQEGGKQAPHLDIAAFFILRARELYMAEPAKDPAIWLVKKSALYSGHWKLFRHRHRDTMVQSIDLEKVQPFGGGDARRCCLVMDHRPLYKVDSSKVPRLTVSLKDAETSRRVVKPKADESVERVRSRLIFSKAPEPLPQARSDYIGKKGEAAFRQGATILPKALLLVDQVHPARSKGRVIVTTMKSKHKPWRDVSTSEIEISVRWFQRLYLSLNMMPFIAALDETRAIIPLDEHGMLLESPEDEDDCWTYLDEIYSTYAGRGRGTPKTLIGQIDFARKLSAQIGIHTSERRMILYPGSGDIMRAARTRSGTGFVGHTLFWSIVDTESEAGYLTSILNAPCLVRAFRESRDSGRHFQLSPWRKVPIPLFDPDNPIHMELADLCWEAEEVAVEMAQGVRKHRLGAGQVTISKAIRARLADDGISGRIDQCARRLLPEQAT